MMYFNVNKDGSIKNSAKVNFAVSAGIATVGVLDWEFGGIVSTALSIGWFGYTNTPHGQQFLNSFDIPYITPAIGPPSFYNSNSPGFNFGK